MYDESSRVFLTLKLDADKAGQFQQAVRNESILLTSLGIPNAVQIISKPRAIYV